MKFRSKLSISLLALSAVGIGAVAKFHAPQAPSPWPSFVADNGHTGNSNSGGALFNSYSNGSVGSVGTNYSSPVLTQGSFSSGGYLWRGALVVGDDSGVSSCIAISAGGTQAWTYSTGGAIKATPHIQGVFGNADEVYVGSDDNYFYRISNAPISGPQGTLIARYLTGGAIRSSACGSSQNVYFGSDDYKVYSLSTVSGLSLDWSYSTGGPVESSPVIDGNNVYVGSDDGYFYAIHQSGALKGTLTWRYNVGSIIRSSPTYVSSNSSLVFGARDSYVYSLNTSGGLNWSYLTGGAVDSSPSQSTDHTKVYIGSDDGYLYCLNASTGALVWNISLGSAIKGAPAVCNDGTIMVSTDTDGVFHVAANGSSVLHHFDSSTTMGSSPAVGRTDLTTYYQRVFYVTNAGAVKDIK